METKIRYRIKGRSIWKTLPRRLLQNSNFKWVMLSVVLGVGTILNPDKMSSAYAVTSETHNSIPEPSTLSLFCAGAVFLFFLRAGKKN